VPGQLASAGLEIQTFELLDFTLDFSERALAEATLSKLLAHHADAMPE
jgi:hypothetical protein